MTFSYAYSHIQLIQNNLKAPNENSETLHGKYFKNVTVTK